MWFYLALATCLINSTAIIFNKQALKGVSPSVLMWFTLVISTPIIGIVAIKEGVPNWNILFSVGIVGSVTLYIIHKIAQYRAMRIADLSAIYPLISLSPILTLVVAFLPPLNEKPGFLAVIGMLMALFGVYILNVSNAKEGLLKPFKMLLENKASALMLISIVADGIVVVFDKLAINNTVPKNTTFVLLIENILTILVLIPTFFLRKKNIRAEISVNKGVLVILGVLNALATILAFAAVGDGNVAIVSTIFSAQTLFVLLFSFLFFKDKPKLETIIGSFIMIAGVVLIKLGV